MDVSKESGMSATFHLSFGKPAGTRWKLHTLTLWFALTCVSLAVNFAAQWRSEHAVNFVSEAARVSWALQHHRGFADPYLSGPSGPTAQMAPIYPFVHAAICLVFGTGA